MSFRYFGNNLSLRLFILCMIPSQKIKSAAKAHCLLTNDNNIVKTLRISMLNLYNQYCSSEYIKETTICLYLRYKGRTSI